MKEDRGVVKFGSWDLEAVINKDRSKLNFFQTMKTDAWIVLGKEFRLFKTGSPFFDTYRNIEIDPSLNHIYIPDADW